MRVAAVPAEQVATVPPAVEAATVSAAEAAAVPAVEDPTKLAEAGGGAAPSPQAPVAADVETPAAPEAPPPRLSFQEWAAERAASYARSAQLGTAAQPQPTQAEPAVVTIESAAAQATQAREAAAQAAQVREEAAPAPTVEDEQRHGSRLFALLNADHLNLTNAEPLRHFRRCAQRELLAATHRPAARPRGRTQEDPWRRDGGGRAERCTAGAAAAAASTQA